MHNYYHYNKIWMVYCSFAMGIILQAIFLFSKVTYYLQPSWMMMLLIYWIIILPNKIGIGTGFILGLSIDCAFGYTLGVHTLSLSLISYLIMYKINYFKHISILQQSFFIFLFSIINQVSKLLIKFLITKILCSPEIFWNCVLDGIIWPVLVFIMYKIFY